MNRLLHSRVFKKNLAKWIFMYIVTLAFFTSVVTYSKYFSSLASNDNARPAKFNIKIDYLGENLEDIDLGDEALINMKPRLRMLTLYSIAQTLGYLVIGTGNLSESMVRIYNKMG